MKVLEETIGEAVGVEFSVKTTGNWADEEIAKLARRLGCELRLEPHIRSAACEIPFQDDKPPVRYVRHKRNRLAHGNETFSSGAALLSPSDLGRLREPVIGDMSGVTASFTHYLDAEVFLHQNAAP